MSAPDAASKNIINFLNQTENGIDSLREELDTLEPTDPRAQNLRMRISEEQKKAEAEPKSTVGVDVKVKVQAPQVQPSPEEKSAILEVEEFELAQLKSS